MKRQRVVVDSLARKLLGESIGVKGARLKEQLKIVLGDLLEEKYPEPSLKRVKGEPKIANLIANE